MDVLWQVFSVLLVFSLLGAALWALRRSGRGKRVLGNQRSMVAVERLALTPQHTLHVVRINGREVVVATHPQGCSVVTPVVASLITSLITSEERAMGAQA
jgi:flagellar biogenesis protein FliO